MDNRDGDLPLAKERHCTDFAKAPIVLDDAQAEVLRGIINDALAKPRGELVRLPTRDEGATEG